MEAQASEVAMPAESAVTFNAKSPEGCSWLSWLKSERRDYVVFCGFSRAERVAMIKQGLPAVFLVKVAADMRVPREEVFKWLGISKASANRKVRARTVLSLSESERTLGFARLIGKVSRIVRESGESQGFDPAKWTASWLGRPNPALGGGRPGEYLDTADGRALIASLVGQMQSGAYA